MSKFWKMAIGTTFLLASTISQAEWSVLGHRDVYRVVLISPADISNNSVYWDAMRTLCNKTFCNVVFVANESDVAVATSRQLSKQERENALMIYTTNSGFSWNCTLRPNADNCFQW